MPKLIRILLVFACLLMVSPAVASSASPAVSAKPIQLYADGKKLENVVPIVRSGILYVPVRKFCEALGYPLSIDAASGEITAIINGFNIEFKPGRIWFKTDRFIVSLYESLPVVNGQVYIPIRRFGEEAQLNVAYDHPNRIVTMRTYEFEYSPAILELVTKDYETPDPSNSSLPVKEFEAHLDSIVFDSTIEAKLRVTYIKNTEVLNRQDEYEYSVLKADGQWKLTNRSAISSRLELPEGIEKQSASLTAKDPEQTEKVLSDLRIFYQANNEEDVALTVQYTSPTFIEQWNDSAASYSWEELKTLNFSDYDVRYRLSDERVVYIGEKDAVVQGRIERTDPAGSVYEYPALIYMEYANGRWVYWNDIDLSSSFDKDLEPKENVFEEYFSEFFNS